MDANFGAVGSYARKIEGLWAGGRAQAKPNRCEIDARMPFRGWRMCFVAVPVNPPVNPYIFSTRHTPAVGIGKS